MLIAAEELRAFIEAQPMIDTHSHVAGFDFGTPLDDKQGFSLPQILMRDYLLYLAGACGELPAKPGGGEWTIDDAEEHFLALQPLLAEYRGLTTYAVLREGIRELHPFNEPDITPANWREINDSIVAAYRAHGERAWLRRVAQKAGIVKQTQMTAFSYPTTFWDSLPAEEREAEKNLLMPSLILDGLLHAGWPAHRDAREQAYDIVGMWPKTYQEHLAFCEAVLDAFVSHGGVSVKILAAYSRSLRFEEVPDETAAAHFAKGPETLAGAPLRELQDNLCHKILAMAVERGLPLIVHTGYSIPSSQGDPENLLNLAAKFRKLKIDLAHSGWPRHGQALLMARTYRNCYFNLCWTPVLSEELGRRILGEAIDSTPRNKILLGTDCGTVEAMLGTVRLLRRVLFEVLREKMSAGQFDLPVAKSYARAILYDNPREFYGLAVESRVVEA